jgi:hypothetical protein
MDDDLQHGMLLHLVLLSSSPDDILFLYRDQTMITSKQLQSKVNQGLAPREHMVFHHI